MTLPVEGDDSQQRLRTAVEFIRERTRSQPCTAIILGSGLGGLANRIEATSVIPFAMIPGFGTSSASGHRGELILGMLESTTVVAMAGRFHRYEGWSNEDVALPVRVMAALGATQLIVSNAAGGVNPKLRVGDILVIRDHINLMGGKPARSIDTAAGTLARGGDAYDPMMSRIAMRVAIENQFTAYEGTYLATLGPTYETRSEYRMMRRIGADVAGMSTVPEVLAALDVKMRVLGLSMVSNVANPDQPVKADHAEVLKAGRAAEVRMEAIVRGVLRSE